MQYKLKKIIKTGEELLKGVELPLWCHHAIVDDECLIFHNGVLTDFDNVFFKISFRHAEGSRKWRTVLSRRSLMLLKNKMNMAI